MSAQPTDLLQHIPRESFHPKALAFLEAHQQEPWFLACSGGADSVCLLYCIHLLFPHKCRNLHILHYNHDLRGEDSDQDATFVEELAAQLDHPFHSVKGTGLHGKSEADLRDARLSFFHRTMETFSARILLQGHHLGDVTETVLMRLSRGSSSTGLAAPRPVQPFSFQNKFHVRPLLGVRRQQIHTALNASGIAWREDSSNTEPTYYRNRIRNQLLPLWEKLSPQILDKAVAHSRDLLEEDDEALNQWADNAYRKLKTDNPHTLQWPKNVPAAILRRIFFLWLPDAGISAQSLTSEIVQLALDAICSTTSLQLSITPERTLKIDPNAGFLSLTFPIHNQAIRPWPATNLPSETSLYLPNGYLLVWRYLPLTDDIFDQLKSGKIDPSHSVWLNPSNFSQLPQLFSVRQRQPGDHYQPLGMQTPAKLQNILVNRKIPAPNRDQLPILTAPNNHEILWCPGCPAPETFKISNPLPQALQIQYIRASNFPCGF